MNAKYRRMVMCHMVADDLNELLIFAEKLGLKKEWLQKPNTHHVHFDVSAETKKRALKLGAIEISRREMAIFLRNKKRSIDNGD